MTPTNGNGGHTFLGLRFDGTINAGHIVTALAVVASFLIAWVRMDDRVSAVDARLTSEIAMRAQSETYASEQVVQLRGDIRDLNQSIRELTQSQRQEGQ